MLKGISLQLNAITAHLETQMRQNDITWDTYHLNTEKNALELLKLVRIALTELDEYLPRDVGQAFDRASVALRSYFKARPRGEVQQQQEDFKYYRSEFDEVQHFLDNKPEIVTNDQERGELFKFLAMNQQKQKNNKILLEEMPKFNNEYAYHPMRNKSGFNQNLNINQQSTLVTHFPDILKPSSKNVVTTAFKLQSKGSQHEKRCHPETKEEETQTDLTLMSTQQIFFQDSSTIVEGTVSSNFNNNLAQSIQISASVVQAQETTEKKEQRREAQQNEGENHEEERDQEIRRKKIKGTFKEDMQQASIQNTNPSEPNITELKLAEGGASIITSSKKIIKEDSLPKFNLKSKKNQDKRQSSNSLSSNRKDIVKGINIKKQGGRSSKDPKQGKRANQSKFSKEKKEQSSSRFNIIIQQAQQELIGSNSYEANKQEVQPQSEIVNIEIPLNEDKKEEILEVKQEEQPTKVQQQNLIPREEELEQESKQPEQTTAITKKLSKKQFLQREKVASNKEEVLYSDTLIEQAYTTAGNNFYRKPSKVQQAAETTLPKIDERRRQDKVQSLKRKIYESSPYAKDMLQSDQKQLKSSNSSMQLNHRSLHLNPDTLYLKSTLSPKDVNGFRQRTELNRDYRGQTSYRMDYKGVPTQEREELLRQEHLRVVKEIEENVGRRAQPQWTKVLRSIRHYELMHATLCGQNCIHLNKFYEFLKKKNLASYLNRKELPLHKKNIEIFTVTP